MRKYFVRLEDNHYLLPGMLGHGYKGWLSNQEVPLDLVLKDDQLLSMVLGGAFALGNHAGAVYNLASVLVTDANRDSKSRDTEPGYYQIPVATNVGARNGPRDFLIAVRDAKNLDGSKRYALDIRTNCHATKVTFDQPVHSPRATGVEFSDSL